ncbi:SCP2 sterol-binding domain-containing protein [Micromonospora sp. NPDC000089]|uniref:SCP2 sterol-binding domain-containing protein n=1 Tax=unclassified Micromonospora TaxID=2617518 RepID=UPI00369A1412
MADTVTRFFDDLARHGHERLLPKTSGTIRFDLRHGHTVDHWFVEFGGGAVRVTRDERDADTVIGADEDFFRRMALGEAKPLTAWLRNDITAEGQFRFVVILERLFPAPPGARHPRSLVRNRRVRR